MTTRASFARRPRSALRAWRARLALAPLILALSPAPARPAADPRAALDLVVTARVVDDTGWPIHHARVSAEGGRGASAQTGSDGHCALRAPIGAPRDLATHPIAITLRARAHGERLTFVDGSDALRIDLSIVGAAPGGAIVRVRSNSAPVTAAIAAALREGAGGGIPCEASFVGIPTAAPSPRAADPGSVLDVTVPGLEVRGSTAGAAAPPAAAVGPAATMAAPAPRPVPPPSESSTPASTTTHATSGSHRGVDSTAVARGSRPAPPPLKGTSVQTTRTMPRVISTPSNEVPVLISSLPARDPDHACTCRVTGTVEVNWSQPLPRPLIVTVALVDQPAVRDTVRLDMGSPRAFELLEVPCGSHRVQALLKHAPFVLGTPEGDLLFNCDRGSSRPIRIVLVRR